MANGRLLRGVIIHATVSLSKFRMLTRGYRAGSSVCGSEHIPLVPKLRLPLLRRAGVFLYARTVICVFDPSVCTTCETCFLCFSEVMLRGLIFCAVWIGRSCVASDRGEKRWSCGSPSRGPSPTTLSCVLRASTLGVRAKMASV